MSALPLALIVEDESDQADLLRRHIERSGYRSVVASTAEQAAVLLKDASPDLAIVDLILPGVSGAELAQMVRSEHPDCFLVISSVHDASRYPESDAHLPKPFTREQVHAVAEQARR